MATEDDRIRELVQLIAAAKDHSQALEFAAELKKLLEATKADPKPQCHPKAAQ